jgi:hypothetical protein
MTLPGCPDFQKEAGKGRRKRAGLKEELNSTALEGKTVQEAWRVEIRGVASSRTLAALLTTTAWP